jgi:hypothetical protein
LNDIGNARNATKLLCCFTTMKVNEEGVNGELDIEEKGKAAEYLEAFLGFERTIRSRSRSMIISPLRFNPLDAAAVLIGTLGLLAN